MIDIHSHILPGIDDGARSIQDSVAMVRELSEQGVTDIIATPHYVDESNYVSSRSSNLKLVKELKKELKKADIDVSIYLGNEIFIAYNLLDLLQSDKISTMAGSKYLLVELPLNDLFQNYDDILLELLQNGYQVLLAHPERYSLVQRDFHVLDDLLEAGLLLQCNTGSILGQYGKEAKKTIKKLADAKMIFGLGTDLHHCRGDGYIAAATKKFSKYYDEKELKKVLVDNPKKMLKK